MTFTKRLLLHCAVLSMLTTTMLHAASEVEQMRHSVVRISITIQNPDYREPWKEGDIGSGVGTGFLISGHRIMTNAHVISNTRMILVQREGDPRRYPARVKFVAHDCDLALLEVDDPRFFAGMVPLEIGGLPELHSSVTAYGYPIGGQRMSVTRGVVSRIEFRTYSHSMLDSHLTVQIDAAINPGNSGGPVIQDDKVVGVAFQGLTGGQAQSIGYMIPTPVVNRFLEDVKDGRYDGYVELAVSYMNLINPSYRAFLGLPDDDLGVVVTDVLQGGSADGVLKDGDVLLAIDGHPIMSNGNISLDGDDTQMEEIVERKFIGDPVKFVILRDGKKQEVTVTLKGAWPYRIFALHYDEKPRYVEFCGLLFQPLSRELVDSFGIANPDVLYYFGFFVTDKIYQQRPEVVVLSSILPDEINTRVSGFAPSVVDKVNGVTITNLKTLAAELDKPAQMYVIDIVGQSRPIVISAAEVSAAQQRVRERYAVTQDEYLGP